MFRLKSPAGYKTSVSVPPPPSILSAAFNVTELPLMVSLAAVNTRVSVPGVSLKTSGSDAVVYVPVESMIVSTEDVAKMCRVPAGEREAGGLQRILSGAAIELQGGRLSLTAKRRPVDVRTLYRKAGYSLAGQVQRCVGGNDSATKARCRRKTGQRVGIDQQGVVDAGEKQEFRCLSALAARRSSVTSFSAKIEPQKPNCQIHLLSIVIVGFHEAELPKNRFLPLSPSAAGRALPVTFTLLQWP